MLRRRFVGREVRGFAVRGTARCEDDLLHFRLHRVLEHVDQAEHVHLRVELRIARADRHAVLRGVMAHNVGRELAKDALDAGIADIEMHERRLRG